jgi:ubiquinone/menaquinone biosynthesis C-methylase UbiE
MPSVHFVEDYERNVDKFLSHHPLDEAMQLAVGGHFDLISGIEVDIITAAGLTPEMSVLDLGCGSGRTAIPLATIFPKIDYTGIDVVQRLLDYATSKCPPHFRFLCHQDVTIPLPDGRIDITIAFSLFVHASSA